MAEAAAAAKRGGKEGQKVAATTGSHRSAQINDLSNIHELAQSKVLETLSEKRPGEGRGEEGAREVVWCILSQQRKVLV